MVHSPWSTTGHKIKNKPTAEELISFTQSLEPIYERCRRGPASTPQLSHCPFCPQEFEGPDCWDVRMEYVARREEDGDAMIRDDVPLRQWARDEGIVKFDGELDVLAHNPFGGR